MFEIVDGESCVNTLIFYLFVSYLQRDKYKMKELNEYVTFSVCVQIITALTCFAPFNVALVHDDDYSNKILGDHIEDPM